MGICERVRNAKNAKELHDLLNEVLSYDYVSKKTLGRIDRLADRRTKELIREGRPRVK